MKLYTVRCLKSGEKTINKLKEHTLYNHAKLMQINDEGDAAKIFYTATAILPSGSRFAST